MGATFPTATRPTLVDHRPEGVAETANAVAPYALDPQNARRLWGSPLEAVS